MTNALLKGLFAGEPAPTQKGLLGDVLPWVYSKGNALRGLLSNPVESAQNAVADANTRAGGLLSLHREATNEGMAYGPKTNALAGLLADSYNPIGMTQIGARGIIPPMSALDEAAKERAARVSGMEESYRLPNLHNAVPKDYLPKQYGSQMVTVYRGVPSTVADANIRPGDWVTLDRRYAMQHGTGETGKSRVIALQVPADHVGWAGTDMNEFFYVPR
jgi:hypothetical protein